MDREKRITRSSSSKLKASNPEPIGLPQLIPLRGPVPGSHAASATEVKESFLKIVGTISSQDIEIMHVMSKQNAEVLACALSHEYYDDPDLIDPYFTAEEWRRVTNKRRSMIDRAKELFEEDSPQLGVEEWMHDIDQLKLCECIAHQDDENYQHCLSSLIEISVPLTDDSGNTLASKLTKFILDKTDQDNIEFKSCLLGSDSSVSYMLKLPSGKEILYDAYIFRGHGDFILEQRFSLAERRIANRKIAKPSRVRASGAVQSLKGNTTTVKTLSMAQAGIYAVGQLANLPFVPEKPKSIASVVLFKDLTACIALATLNPDTSNTDSFGSVEYKHINNISYNLREKNDLQQFANVFVSALKFCCTL